MSGWKVGVVLVWVVSCSARSDGLAPTPTDGGGSDRLVVGDGAPSGDCPADVMPSRAVSERCCPAFGADACGASLFCAALDGRTIPTCYPERSRAVGASCTANNQCVSGGCNTTRMVCQQLLAMPCDPAVGCAPNGGRRTVCTGNIRPSETIPPQCQAVGSGALCEPCETDADCRGQGDTPTVCNERHRCAFPANLREDVARFPSGCDVGVCCAGNQEGSCSSGPLTTLCSCLCLPR